MQNLDLDRTPFFFFDFFIFPFLFNVLGTTGAIVCGGGEILFCVALWRAMRYVPVMALRGPFLVPLSKTFSINSAGTPDGKMMNSFLQARSKIGISLFNNRFAFCFEMVCEQVTYPCISKYNVG